MKKTLLIVTLTLLTISTGYSVKMTYNKPDGSINRFEPDETQILNNNTIGGSIVYENVDWTKLGLGSSQQPIFKDDNGTPTSVQKSNISEFSDFVDEYSKYQQENAYKAQVVNGLKSEVWSIADKYGVTNSPLNWFYIKAAIKDTLNNTNLSEAIRQQARDDGQTLTADTVFLQSWQVDLFNITR